MSAARVSGSGRGGLLETHAPAAVILIRLMVGIVFLSEGIQKFVYPDQLGVGRFTKIGLPAPDVLAPFVGVVEIVGGVLILLGFLTRLAASALIVDMLVAITTTKIPILLGHDLGPFLVAKMPRYGLWAMLHESRTDLSMLLGSIFLLIVGAGLTSIDARLARRRTPP